MLSPDYQEFANRGVAGYPWQYRDFTSWHERSDRNHPGVAGLPRKNEHESGTFCLSQGAKLAFCALANASLARMRCWRPPAIPGM